MDYLVSLKLTFWIVSKKCFFKDFLFREVEKNFRFVSLVGVAMVSREPKASNCLGLFSIDKLIFKQTLWFLQKVTLFGTFCLTYVEKTVAANCRIWIYKFLVR